MPRIAWWSSGTPGNRSAEIVRTEDRLRINAPASKVFAAAADVERWPELLPHYRWVKLHGRQGDALVVEMAAWRPFGIFNYPTWWKSLMWTDPAGRSVQYQHIPPG